MVARGSDTAAPGMYDRSEMLGPSLIFIVAAAVWWLYDRLRHRA